MSNSNGTITFITGGCRSGKSSHAVSIAEQASGDGRIFLATCMPYDDEMKKRVARHRNERDESWTTVEAPYALPVEIDRHGETSGVILVDCITLWITNLLLKFGDEELIFRKTEDLVTSLAGCGCPVVLVSNEVGGGIVPENSLARQFRDIAGLVNQKIAACADRVIWTVSGIPVTIKPGK